MTAEGIRKQLSLRLFAVITQYPRDPQAEACHWIVGRSNPDLTSHTMTDERVDALQDDYGVPLTDMLRNVALCHNAENNNNGGQLYVGPERYPPCFFGMPFVDGEFELNLPLWLAAYNGSHKAEYPEWMDSVALGDHWNDALELVCDQESDDKPEECDRLQSSIFGAPDNSTVRFRV
jgi:hypothetical protein